MFTATVEGGTMRVLRLVLVASALSFPVEALAAAPPNDAFADAIDLGSSTGVVFEGTNVAATKETGEPDHAGNAGGRSVWFTWTAPVDGSVPHVAIVTQGAFDTLLGVYTGAAVDSLTEVASNDDDGVGRSSVSFPTSAGTTYRIAVDGFAGKAGRFSVAATPSPSNDNFGEAIALSGASGARKGDILHGATIELGELFFVEPATIWYSWQPPADGTYKLSTIGSSRVDTVLAVFEGSSVESLTLLAVNDDDPDRGCCSSWIPLVDAEATKTYMIQVSSFGTSPSTRIAISWGPLILGTNGANTLTGTALAEEIRGRGGADTIVGGGGADLLFGGAGSDLLRGGAGNDLLFDHAGLDVLRGETGDDRLTTRDGRAGDRASGGDGTDRCSTDRRDIIRSCP
jgi:Ca2+-binding RTX toxin-like protein